MRTALDAARELEAIVTDLEKDLTALELAVTAFIGVQFGDGLEVDTSLSIRQRVKYITATIKDIT